LEDIAQTNQPTNKQTKAKQTNKQNKTKPTKETHKQNKRKKNTRKEKKGKENKYIIKQQIHNMFVHTIASAHKRLPTSGWIAESFVGEHTTLTIQKT